MAQGKAELAFIVVLLGILTSLGIGIVVYSGEENGVTYEVTLTDIDTDYDTVWGSIILTVINGNDFDIAFTGITLELIDPSTDTVFYTYSNDGDSIERNGGKLRVRIDFTITYDDIPDMEIKYRLTGMLTWDNNPPESIVRENIIPLVWSL